MALVLVATKMVWKFDPAAAAGPTGAQDTWAGSRRLSVISLSVVIVHSNDCRQFACGPFPPLFAAAAAGGAAVDTERSLLLKCSY